MSPERWQQVKATLAGALELPDENERAAFLKTACANDTSLRREVESLLAQPDDEFESVSATIGITGTDRLSTDGTGRQVGDYELVRELGRGGMGSVWLARRADKQFEKIAAIKLLKRGTDTDEVLRRFHVERQILARLEHPNIARLLDGGVTDDDLPYFVMEYVEGLPVTDFCREHALTIEERLRLFLKICAAVQFAHQNLVVHRDLKPGNILVTPDCEPKLLDFGIAKLLAADDAAVSVTVVEHQRLTPAYASPEQVRGEPVTTVSDVYTLGTLLYEIVTGQNAHRFSVPQPPPTELLRVVGQEEPIRPSSAATEPALARRLRGDLDNIILKALRKEPGRRYTGVGSFAGDIQRYLANEPVTARKDTASYRAAKFVQRNKLGVTAAVIVLLTLIGGIVGIAWEARIAQQRFNDLRRLAHSVLFDYHDAIANLPGSTVVRKKLVTDSLQYLDDLAKKGRRDESLEREIAAGYVKVGDVQGRPYFPNLGDTPGALASYSKAVAFFEALAARHPEDSELQTQRATALTRVSEVHREMGKLDASLAAARQAVAIMEDVQSRTTAPDVREGVALAYTTLADVMGNPFTGNLGDAKGAMGFYERALAIREELYRAEPKNAERARPAGVAHSRVAALLWASNDKPSALRHYEAELAIDEGVLAADPNHVVSQRAVAVDLSLIVPIVLETGDIARARELLTRCIRLFEQITTADPQNAAAKADLAIAYSRMIAVLGKSGDRTGAERSFEQAFLIYQGQLEKEPENTMVLMTMRATYARMAEALLDLKQPDDAFAYATKGVETADRLLSRVSRPDTQRFKAHSLLQRARIHTVLAGSTDKSALEQRPGWTAARTDYEEALQLLDSIPEKAALAMDKPKREEAIAGIAKCDAALKPAETIQAPP